MIRTFIAIELPDSLCLALADLQERLRERLDGEGAARAVRWAKPGGIHLTLKFLGEVEEDFVPDIALALEGAAQGVGEFELEPARVGCFPDLRSPRIVWVGFGAAPEPLFRLVRQVEEAMAGLRFPRERRDFQPHLTVGRVADRTRSAERKAVGRIVREVGAPAFAPFRVTGAALMQSELGREGARYTRLVECRYCRKGP